MRKDLDLYFRLLKYIKPHRKIVILSVVGMICSAALEPVLPALMQPLIDKSLIQRDGQSHWQIPVFIVITFVLKGLADYVANVASQTVAQKVIADLRGALFAHQLDLPVGRHLSEEAGRMLSRITFDTSMVGEAVSTAWLTIIRDSLVLIGLVSFLFYTAWQLSLLVLVLAPALAYAIRRINRRLRTSSEHVQKWMGRVTGHVEEALLGLKEVKMFGAHSLQAERFDRINQGLRREQSKAARIQAINVPLVQILAAFSVALVVLIASSLSRDGLLTPGEFVAFITAMSMVFEPIRRLTNVSSTLQRGMAASESIFGILDEQGEEHSVTRTLDRGKIPRVKKLCLKSPPSIQFSNVSYRYPGVSQWSIKDFSLTIPGGSAVALVGQSGSGKTSLLNLLCQFDSPTCGDIILGGVSLKEIPPNVLRAQIALVGQQTLLFDLTVLENLRLARPAATDAELVEALRDSDALDFVLGLPKGLDTRLGILGAKLSGGQRQRISLARAFVKNAPILVLDEPTSALDRLSEARVFLGIKRLMQGKTTIVVTHSPERILDIGRIISL